MSGAGFFYYFRPKVIDRGIDLSALGFLSPRPKVVRASPSRGDAAAFCSLPVQGGGRYRCVEQNTEGESARVSGHLESSRLRVQSPRALTLRTNNSRHRSGVRWKTWAPLLCTRTSIRAKEINNLSSSFWNARVSFSPSMHIVCRWTSLAHCSDLYCSLVKINNAKTIWAQWSGNFALHKLMDRKKTLREVFYSHESWFENDCLNF